MTLKTNQIGCVCNYWLWEPTHQATYLTYPYFRFLKPMIVFTQGKLLCNLGLVEDMLGNVWDMLL